MGTRNVVWAQRQRAGGPLEKLLFLYICEAIPERAFDPCLETSRGFLADYCEVQLWRIDAALDALEAAQLVRVDGGRDRLFLRIPFPAS